MSSECDKCGEHAVECFCKKQRRIQASEVRGKCPLCCKLAYECPCTLVKYVCWIDGANELPPLGEVIEARTQKKHPYNKIGRDYFALVAGGSELRWINTDLSPHEYSDFKITHWRHIPPDPWGKKPFVKVRKGKDGYFKVNIYFKNMQHTHI